jgi:hypothetical protein
MQEGLRILNSFCLFLQALLTSVSRQLYDATGGRGRFGELNVLVPASWNNEECLQSRQMEPASSRVHQVMESDFVVDSPHPIYGAEPWAQQYGQCGVGGLSIKVPYSLLLDESRISAKSSKFPAHPS